MFSFFFSLHFFDVHLGLVSASFLGSIGISLVVGSTSGDGEVLGLVVAGFCVGVSLSLVVSSLSGDDVDLGLVSAGF